MEAKAAENSVAEKALEVERENLEVERVNLEEAKAKEKVKASVVARKEDSTKDSMADSIKETSTKEDSVYYIHI